MKISLKTTTWDIEDVYIWKEKYVNLTFMISLLALMNALTLIYYKSYITAGFNAMMYLIYLIPTFSFKKWRKSKYGNKNP